MIRSELRTPSSMAVRVATGRQSIVRGSVSTFRLDEDLGRIPIGCGPAGGAAQPPAWGANQRRQRVSAAQRNPPAERKFAHEARRAHRLLGPRPQLGGPVANRAGGGAPGL